jgi:hypothetical protein
MIYPSMTEHRNISHVSRQTCAKETWTKLAKMWSQNVDNVRKGLRNRSNEQQTYSLQMGEAF